MKKAFFLVGFLMFSSLCFAVDYYAEYSFAETRLSNKSLLTGIYPRQTRDGHSARITGQPAFPFGGVNAAACSQ
jgi:hypothetical protein